MITEKRKIQLQVKFNFGGHSHQRRFPAGWTSGWRAPRRASTGRTRGRSGTSWPCTPSPPSRAWRSRRAWCACRPAPARGCWPGSAGGRPSLKQDTGQVSAARDGMSRAFVRALVRWGPALILGYCCEFCANGTNRLKIWGWCWLWNWFGSEVRTYIVFQCALT